VKTHASAMPKSALIAGPHFNAYSSMKSSGARIIAA
jgi:hypothetical protein